jgi:two-component system response regulator YesN
MTYHLLIVDDENTIRKGLADYMPWNEINCVVDGAARDGMEAIDFLKNGKLDIVITDIKMPRCDGIELAKYIHENCPRVKMIILTGYAEFEYAHSAISYGVTDYLLKPISKDTLMESVKKIIVQIDREREDILSRRRDIGYLREQLLRELAGDSPNREKQLALAADYGIMLDDYYAAVFDAGEGAAGLDYALESLAGQYPNDYVFSLNDRLFWLSRAGESPRPLLDTCTEIVNIGRQLYACFVSAGISGLHRGLEELPQAAAEALSALGQNFYSGQNVSLYKAANAPSANIHELCTGELFAIEKNLKERQFDAARQSAASLFSKLKSLTASEFDAKTICIQVYYICISILLQNGLTLPQDQPSNGRATADFFVTVHNTRVIHVLETAVFEVLKNTSEILSSQGRALNPLVKKALRYIHDNYQKALSLELIAEQIHVNPSHLSRTFKKELDEPVTEYINKIRIEKSKELLTVSGMLAYEAAEAVGFNDPAYFSQVFKKITGVSPKDFKNSGFHYACISLKNML